VNIVQSHAKVFLDLLDADNLSGDPLVVYDGRVTGTADHYVLVYFAFRTPSGTDEPQKVSLEATSDVLDATAYCHSVGGDAAAARAVAGRVRAALLGVSPTVAGRLCYPIEHADGPPMQRDEATGTPVFDQVDVYKLTSQPG
jgi:hypothetical protein